MERNLLDLYGQPAFIRDVEENLLRDPLEVALDRSVPYAREVATRVKYLQRARTKLPSYCDARCIVPGRAYEQSSGERSAFAKKYGGGLCVDLTCGLGVDSFAFSRNFEKVIAVEPDLLLAETARYNFRLLGAENIEVVEMSAEEFLGRNPGLRADLIYIDPDRRDGRGKKMSALADCSPDVSELLPRLRRVSDRVVVKLSPLFDVHEAFRVFGDRTRVVAVSDAGECKEVLVETGASVAGPLVAARVLGRGETEYGYGGPIGIAAPERLPAPADFRYLIVPDVAFIKTGTAVRYYTEHGCFMPSPKGYVYAQAHDGNIIGKTFRIVSPERFLPKKIKAALKARGTGRLNIMARDFPADAPSIARQLGIREGGTDWAAFTTYGGVHYCFFLEPVGR